MENTEMNITQISGELPVPTSKPKERSRGRDGVFVKNHKYWISYTDGQGRRRMEPTAAPTLTQAREIRAAELVKAENQRRFGYTEPTKDTFSDVVPKYLDYQRARVAAGSYGCAKGILQRHLEPHFGSMRLQQIKKRHIEDYVTLRRNGEASPASVTKELHTLKHLLSYSVEQELIASNPAKGVKAPKPGPLRVRYLQPAEVVRVLKACPEWLRPIVGLLVFTGMRRCEALNLRTSDVDLALGNVVLQHTKNGDSRVVWLNDLARQVLISSMRPDAKPTDRVFVGDKITPENVSMSFLRVSRTCGIEDCHLHDLRHTAASWMRMSGADLQDVAAVLGHRNLKMTQRYAHLSPKHLSGVVKTLDAAFGEEMKQVKMLGAAQQ
jgi:site-specific recombinase XerD